MTLSIKWPLHVLVEEISQIQNESFSAICSFLGLPIPEATDEGGSIVPGARDKLSPRGW